VILTVDGSEMLLPPKGCLFRKPNVSGATNYKLTSITGGSLPSAVLFIEVELFFAGCQVDVGPWSSRVVGGH